MARPKASLAVVALFAAACATPAPPPTVVPPPPPRPQVPMAVTPPQVMAPLPPVAQPEIAMTMPAPSDAQSLRARYGAPDFVRREMDAELWRYDAGACAIFFFLYRDGDAFRVRYSETAPRGRDMAADPDCVERLNARERMS